MKHLRQIASLLDRGTHIEIGCRRLKARLSTDPFFSVTGYGMIVRAKITP
jgi:hypothetical protein